MWVPMEQVADALAGLQDVTAALDVTDPEPLGPDHPLWALPNALITPHVAGSTPASAIAAARFVREQAERFRDGRPLANVITGDY